MKKTETDLTRIPRITANSGLPLPMRGETIFPGVRPSPGAATLDWSSAAKCSRVGLHFHIAAPGDGRTPQQPLHQPLAKFSSANCTYLPLKKMNTTDAPFAAFAPLRGKSPSLSSFVPPCGIKISLPGLLPSVSICVHLWLKSLSLSVFRSRPIGLVSIRVYSWFNS
jgi:hypothetical protein